MAHVLFYLGQYRTMMAVGVGVGGVEVVVVAVLQQLGMWSDLILGLVAVKTAEESGKMGGAEVVDFQEREELGSKVLLEEVQAVIGQLGGAESVTWLILV